MVTTINRPPVVAGPITITRAEDAGQFRILPFTNTFDPDTADILSVVDIQAELPPGVTWDAQFGSFIVDTTHAAFQSLAVGQSSVITISYAVFDGTVAVPHSIIFTVTGVNDGAVIGGATAGVATEDANLPVTGLLTVADADAGEASFIAGTLAGAYGSLTLDASGAWVYVLDNANASVNALATGQSLVETITVTSIDGTEQVISITVNGADETTITGTAAADVLTGTGGGETILGLGGNDRLTGNGGADVLEGGSGADSLYGGDGDDILVFDFNDRVQSGGAGIDTLTVDRAITVNLGATDQVSGDRGVTSGIENVDASFATSSVVLTGSSGTNLLSGGAAGDRLTGGLGADLLIGNGGADQFIFRTLAESQGALADEIGDFTHGVDKINVSAIDAIAGTSTNNTFVFIGGAAFSRAGQLRYDAATGAVEADVNGDGIADLSIDIGAGLTITASDFVL